MIFRAAGAALCAILLIACDKSTESPDYESSNKLVTTAEKFVEVFYSFDPAALRTALSSAENSIPAILFYQGWAEGGNYEVVARKPCRVENEGAISCAITVKDDLIGALGIDFNVTDTFHLTFSDGQIVSATNSSNDPQAYFDARKWVESNRPELIEEACQGFFDGGLTPGDCVRAMVQGYSEFVASGGLSEDSQETEY